MNNHRILEELEPRIAPAAIATFTDVDGDKVTVTSSKGTTPALQALVTAAVDMGQITTVRF